ncbi:MAG: LamG domain-containing protein [Kofleriaceae bacterium]|nr:LamG domain-containing protein [Kofleriaceae bacterium]
MRFRFVVLALGCAACGRVSFDDVRADSVLDGTARSYPEVVLADTPYAYYRFDEAAGTVVADSSGHGADAYLPANSGEIEYRRPGALPGDSSTALRLAGEGNAGAGTEAQVWLSDLWMLWGSDFTAELFVRPLAPTPPGFATSMLVCERYLVNGFRSGWDDANHVQIWSHESGGADKIQTDNASLALNRWAHVALVRRGGSIEIYLDGVLQANAPFGYVAPDDAPNCGIGSFAGLPQDAEFDELAIYDRALSPARIAAHHAASGR